MVFHFASGRFVADVVPVRLKVSEASLAGRLAVFLFFKGQWLTRNLLSTAVLPSLPGLESQQVF